MKVSQIETRLSIRRYGADMATNLISPYDEPMNKDLVSIVMREMGRKGGKAGGKKGGRARMAALTPEQRKELARRAIQARWAKSRAKGKVSRKKKPK
jgi:hypothetical protein